MVSTIIGQRSWWGSRFGKSEAQHQMVSKTTLFVFVFVGLQPLLNAQNECIQDYYGYWTALNDKYIEIRNWKGKMYEKEFNVNSSVIGIVCDKKYQYKGTISIRRGFVTISVRWKKMIFDTSYTHIRNGVELRFFVKELDNQMMVIKPYCRETKRIFGKNPLRLFNELYVASTAARFDSLHFYASRRRNLGNMGINLLTGQMTKERNHYGRNRITSDIYMSHLDSSALTALIRFISQSGLLKMSKCGLRNNSAYWGGIVHCCCIL